MQAASVSCIPVGTCSADTIAGRRLQAAEWAMQWVKLNEDSAVVFDIDDTLLSSDQPFPEMIALYRACKDMGLQCYIVTARPYSVENEARTTDTLRGMGVTGFRRLYMMPERTRINIAHVSKYKASAREKIAKKRKIVLNIGDSWSDFFRFPLADAWAPLVDSDTNDIAVFFDGCTACIKLPKNT